ncbi:hypothetical protein [Mycolicibacterium rhodesiae]|uniref:Uncharacterized protein n=1 Tax=Mycolicibacterium rhodesiae TaxID=36814 RepID=A0A1X0ISR9_MYCRH|nr:hypothetical protein [Mycolicibacterium rhodesiae]MCV7343792.1 hypothetical protein [Mycolicibacterium rhodesiae]ORB51278.1 hypothetical protein BST42_17825 [Mycolicibacterium rhodesiae]
MWILTVIATLTGVAGLTLSLRNYRHMKHAPVRDNQMKIRGNLRQTLLLTDYHHLEKALNQLESRLPSDRIKDELSSLREYLILRKDEFIAPTHEQISALVATIDTAISHYEAATGVPTDDSIFAPDGDKPARQQLKADLSLLRTQVRCIISGINEIDKNAFGIRRQIALFKELENVECRPESDSTRKGVQRRAVDENRPRMLNPLQ